MCQLADVCQCHFHDAPHEGDKAGEEQRRLEVVADEVTPSLRWATAKVTKAARAAGEPDTAGDDEPPF